MYKIGKYMNIHTDTWVCMCISKQILLDRDLKSHLPTPTH